LQVHLEKRETNIGLEIKWYFNSNQTESIIKMLLEFLPSHHGSSQPVIKTTAARHANDNMTWDLNFCSNKLAAKSTLHKMFLIKNFFSRKSCV
jgi:hypothetical protein